VNISSPDELMFHRQQNSFSKLMLRLLVESGLNGNKSKIEGNHKRLDCNRVDSSRKLDFECDLIGNESGQTEGFDLDCNIFKRLVCRSREEQSKELNSDGLSRRKIRY
jgi:hypothetical protein